MMDRLLLSILPSLIVGVCMAVFNRQQKRRDDCIVLRAESRKKESLLSLELQMATAKLSYATAMALKRGTPNGEVEEGIVAYEAARRKYLSFLNEQAADHLN